MNTLNFFLTLDYPTGDPLDNNCGPGNNVECRGADSDAQPPESPRQRTKLLQALKGLNADILGLNELENSTGVDPLGDATNGIVPGLNDLLGVGTYNYIDTGVIGTDAIRVGLIYKPAVVTPIGTYKLLTSAVDPRFIDTKNRPSLAQTFEENQTGARFTVVVNHLKSKGSMCDDVGDPDAGDGQGNCNGTRTGAAQALVDWLATDPTGSGDPDFLIMGDLNSYSKEDPIDAIKAGPDDTAGTGDDYTNLIEHFQGAYAYSYVFDGQAGYLDQALGSASLLAKVTGAEDWHINSDEPDVLDYDTSFKPPAQDLLYEPNAYRTSDHDPVVVGLNLNEPPTIDAGGPYSVVEGSFVTVTATGSDSDNSPLTYAWDLDNNGSFETAGQSATFDASALTAPSSYTIRVQATDPGGLTGEDTATVNVIYNFNGFFQPVDNGVLNKVKAGSGIPVKFSLTGDQGLAIFAAGYPKSQKITCDASEPVDLIETTVTAGSSSLSYDPLTDTYTYVWKTDKAWATTCRRLEVQLIDGTLYTADFQFTK
jgi:endonuclease/exonuclease/phosphatase family metal-dependent hydrolase